MLVVDIGDSGCPLPPGYHAVCLSRALSLAWQAKGLELRGLCRAQVIGANPVGYCQRQPGNVAGGFGGALVVELAAAAWCWLPSIAPLSVARQSPWPDQAVRAAVAFDEHYHHHGHMVLLEGERVITASSRRGPESA